MAMSRKDYELLAGAFSRSTKTLTHEERNGVVEAIVHVSNALHGDNPRFDRDRFMAACVSEADLERWMQHTMDGGAA